MNKANIFISDTHFGLQSYEDEKIKEDLLVKLLEELKPNMQRLFILGDLFDYWFEYRRVIQKGYFKLFNSINNLTQKGIEVHYIIGNHDFMHRDFFSKELGVVIHKNPIEIILEDKKFFLAHGDGLVENDLGYKILKKILRNKFLQSVYSLIHPDLGIAIASGSSKKSRNYTSEKKYTEGEDLVEVAEKILDRGYDYVVLGHTHKRVDREILKGRYINLGTWLSVPCYGKFEDGKFEIIDWK